MSRLQATELFGVLSLGLLIGCAGAADDMDEPFLMDRAQSLTPSVTSRVAVHVSENTASHWKYDSWKPWQISQFLTRALKSDGTGFDVLTDAQIEGGSLSSSSNARYPILISLANEAVSDTVVNEIRTFVNNGGHAYVGSSSFTRHADGTERGNFALSSEMGLVSRGSWQLTNDVIRVAETPLADVLPLNTPQWHFLPLRHDITAFPAGFVSDLRTNFANTAPNQGFYGSRPIHEGSHWFWDVVPGGSARATVLVRPWPQFGMDHRVSATSSAAPAGFGESIFASSWRSAYDMQVADVNGDRRADLVGRHTTTGDLQVGLSTGQGFAPSSSWGSFALSFQLSLADVDGDGDADLVGRSTSGTEVRVALSAGRVGPFQASTRWTDWNQSYDLWLADVDGDGDADIVGRPKSGGTDVQVGLSLGKQGGKAFQASTVWTNWSQAYTLLLGDVDGDRDADIVGRPKSGGVDVQVSRSLGAQSTNGFQASARWTDWNHNYELRLGDATGDGKVDLIGHRLLGGTTTHDDVLVAASSGSPVLSLFQSPSARWGWWEQGPASCNNGPCDPSICQCGTITCPAPGARQYAPFLGDVNGDGRVDLLGRGIVTPANVALWINKGPVTGIDTGSRPGYGTLLAEKSFGAGKFIYNANLQAFAGYGGDSRILSEYQSLRSAIDAAFASRDEALVRVSPWPYPHQAGFIYRHDHVLNTRIVEKETACGISGEYYIQPDARTTDYPAFVPWATEEVGIHGLQNSAVIGAHQLCHRWPDEVVEDVALARLTSTIESIRGATGETVENFVAPGYIALLKGSLNAVARAGFVTAGEQGFSPFPAFAVDPQVNADLPGSLLQLPVSGVIHQETTSWPEICKNVDTVYAQNGLLNIYDHGGQDAGDVDPVDPLGVGASEARQYLRYVFGPGEPKSPCALALEGAVPPGCRTSGLGAPENSIWKATSSRIRNWWLLRDTKSLSVTQSVTGTRATINVSIATSAPRDGSSHPVSDTALRIRLSPRLITLANQGVSVVLTGAFGSEHQLQGDQLVVRAKNATAAQIILGT